MFAPSGASTEKEAGRSRGSSGSHGMKWAMRSSPQSCMGGTAEPPLASAWVARLRAMAQHAVGAASRRVVMAER